MTEIGCYVERALDRLTVTTMLLCSDSAPKILAGRPASAGLPFLLRCAVLRCVMSCDVPNSVAMCIRDSAEGVDNPHSPTTGAVSA